MRKLCVFADNTRIPRGVYEYNSEENFWTQVICFHKPRRISEEEYLEILKLFGETVGVKGIIYRETSML